MKCIRFFVGDMLYSSMEIPIERSRQFIFCALCSLVNPSIKLLLSDSSTNHKSQIISDSFFDKLFLSMSPLVKFMPMNCKNKNR